MTATLQEVQAFVDKDALVHIKQEDGTLAEVVGKIMVATEAGIGFKPKGKPGVELLNLSDVEEIGAAPTKPKTISKKKLAPVTAEQVRQHLADRHGIEIKWCRDATDEAAQEFHDSIDHGVLGHDHSKVPTEQEQAVSEAEAEQTVSSI